MNFILLGSVALIPVVLGLTIAVNDKGELSKKLCLLMILISMWQLDISVLYAGQFLNEKIIESLFRLFRAGSIFLGPAIFIISQFVYNKVRNEQHDLLKYIYNKYVLGLFFCYSLFLYIVGWTNKGLLGLEVVRGLSIPHYYPMYGEWGSLFTINLILIVLNVLLLTYLSIVARSIEGYPLSIGLPLSFLLLCIIGLISITDKVPLYVSSMNSILITILISTIYFQMHTKMIGVMNTKLEEQQTFLKKVIDHNPSFIYVKNDKGQVVLANKAFLNFYNVTMDEVYGLTEDSLDIPDNDLKRHQEQDQFVIEQGKEIILEEDVMINCNNETKIVEITKVPITKKSTRHILCVVNDITQRKENEKILIQSEKLNVVGELAAGVAHEIRNPLTTLKGFTQIMKCAEPEKYKGYLDLMSNEIERINSVAGELLTISKPMDVPYTNVDVDRILQDVKSLLDTNAILNNIQINIVKTEDDFICSGNTNQLKQVFINLIKNSIEAKPKDGKVHVILERKDTRIHISIIDLGKGISKERIKKIGEPFYTTKEKGTGLGLMVCFKIIKDHKGKVEFQSELGEGTTVEIQLPVAQA